MINDTNIKMNYIISKNKKPCCVCGAYTNKIEINFEAPICCFGCEEIMNKKLIEAEKKGNKNAE